VRVLLVDDSQTDVFGARSLAAGITTFELARIMGTSVAIIEAHYGTLIDTAHDAILTPRSHPLSKEAMQFSRR